MEVKIRTETPPASTSTLDIVAAFESGFPHEVHDWAPRVGKADRDIYHALAMECTRLVLTESTALMLATCPHCEKGMTVRPSGCTTPTMTTHICPHCKKEFIYPVCNKRVLNDASPAITKALKLLSSNTLVHVMVAKDELIY